jgi:ankyrin repeat protein
LRNIDKDRTLFIAAREGASAEVCRLIADGANPNAVDPSDCDHGRFLINLTPLIVAAGSPRSNVETVKALLDLGADPALTSDGGTTALWYAAGGLGFNLETTDWELEEGHVYLDWGGGDVERLRLLLDAGGDPNETPDNGRSLVNEAAAAGDPERLKLLIERGASVSAAGQWGFSVPLFSAAESGRLECVQILLDHGSPANYEDNGNALDKARTAEIAELLWNAGVRPVQHFGFFNSVDSAFENGRYDVARFVLSKLPQTEEGAAFLNEALCNASGTCMNPKAVQILLELGADVNALCGWMGTALHSACWQGDGNGGRPTEVVRETLELLIAAGAQVGRNLPDHGTPLHQAVYGDWGSPTATNVLIRHGAPLDIQDAKGRTPLMCACMAGALECVRLLIIANADRNIRDHSGSTARHHAKEYLKVWKEIVASRAKRKKNKYQPAERDRHLRALAEAKDIVRLLGNGQN